MKKTKSATKPKAKIDFTADKQPPAEGELRRVANLAQHLKDVEYTIMVKLSELQELQETHNRIVSADLPAMMDEFGIKEFSLKDGSKVTVSPIIKAALPAESAIQKCKEVDKRAEMRDRFERGLKYLQKNGAGALVKNTVKANFGKDSSALCKKAVAELRKLGVQVEVTRGVHPQSLTAWVKERLEAGQAVDHDLFAVYSGQIAKITTTKKAEQTKVAEGETF